MILPTVFYIQMTFFNVDFISLLVRAKIVPKMLCVSATNSKITKKTLTHPARIEIVLCTPIIASKDAILSALKIPFAKNEISQNIEFLCSCE